MSGKITDLTAIASIDRANDLLEIVDVSANASYNVTPNNLFGISGGTVMSTTDSETVQNKTLDNTNSVTVKAANLVLQDGTDTTKQAKFVLSGITTGNTRSFTLPDASDTVMTLAATQTATNKTFTSPTITGGTIDNATVTVDSVAGHTTSNTGTIYGVSVTSGIIASAALVGAVNNAAVAANALYASKFYGPYKFSVYRAGALTLTGGTPTLVTFDTETFDTGSNYSVSTGKFTVPVAGFYQLHAVVQTTVAASQAYYVYLYKNGSILRQGSYGFSTAGGATAYSLDVSGLFQLSVNDYIQVYAYINSTNESVSTGASATYFDGELRYST